MRQALTPLLVLARLTAASAQSSNKISFRNDTDETIWTAVHFLDTAQNWVTKGYFKLEPEQVLYVAQAASRSTYVYAYTLGNTQSPRFSQVGYR